MYFKVKWQDYGDHTWANKGVHSRGAHLSLLSPPRSPRGTHGFGRGASVLKRGPREVICLLSNPTYAFQSPNLQATPGL